LAAIAFPVLSGCGGGAGTTSASPPLSQQQFVARANAICATLNQEIEALPALPSPPDLPSTASYASSIEPIFKDAVTKLQQLQPPAPEQDKFNSMLGEVQASIGELPALRAAAESEDLQQVRKINNEFSSNSANVDATDLGLTECARTDVQPQG
jgi:hypothetical protein